MTNCFNGKIIALFQVDLADCANLFRSKKTRHDDIVIKSIKIPKTESESTNSLAEYDDYNELNPSILTIKI